MTTQRAASGSSAIKSQNVQAVLLTLLREEHISRVGLARATGLSTTTITNLIGELLAQGLVVEDSDEKLNGHQRGVGRPQTALRLAAGSRHVIAVHFDVDAVRVAVADLRARIRQVQSLATRPDDSPEQVLAQTAAAVQTVVAASGVDPRWLLGVGAGASGLVDPDTGINVVAPNLGWFNVPVRDELARRLGLPVFADNNVRAMALGEVLFGQGQGARTLAFVYARIGVGAGIVVGGRVYRGSGAGAGEIGHVTMIPDGGEPCRCGNTGCLETLVSEPAIVRRAQDIARKDQHGILASALREGEGTPIERVFAAARAGDRLTLDLLAERARYMGIALANLVNVLNPDRIVLGGLFAQGRDLLLPTVEATLRERAFAKLGERVELETTRFEALAGVVGAAALALDAFFYRQEAVSA